MTPDGGAGWERRDEAPSRPDRKPLVCFVADAETEAALRQGLAQAAPPDAEFRRATGPRAVEALRGMPTPWTIVVDVSGHEHPLALLEDLSAVVEPDVRVLVIGDRSDVAFYRHLTRGLGVVDYLYKPLVPATVGQHFAPVVAGQPGAPRLVSGARLVGVTGARGGAGASTIAANLAWLLAEVAQRHTLALDADLQRGTLPLLLGASAGPGLRQMLERPERVDELVAERAASAPTARLRLLASEEPVADELDLPRGGAERVLAVVRRRFNYVVADLPHAAGGFARELAQLAQTRIVVMEPTLPGIRDALRLLQLPSGPGQTFRPLLVVNRAGRRGTLPLRQVAETMRREPDVVIRDLPAAIEAAGTLGKPAAAAAGPFRQAIETLAQLSCGIPAPARRGLFGMFRR